MIWGLQGVITSFVQVTWVRVNQQTTVYSRIEAGASI